MNETEELPVLQTAPLMAFRWVWARYSGKQAEYVAGVANAGFGYFVLERPERGHAWIAVAFLYPENQPLGDHLEEIHDKRMVAKLNTWKDEK